MTSLDVSKETATNFLKALGADWHVGQLLMTYARQRGAMLPEEFVRRQLETQRATTAAVAGPVAAETRRKLVYLGEGREPLSNIALVFREDSPGQFEARQHPEAMMIEYIYHGAGSPKVTPLGTVQSNDRGVIVNILDVSPKVEGGKAALARLMRDAGWKVDLG